MKPPSLAPFFAAIWPALCEAARARGYALAIHGTLCRDFDIIAAPWTEDAIEPQLLVDALAEAVDGWVPTMAKAEDEPEPVEMPRARPHGRLAWLIYFKRSSSYIDVSVMPRLAAGDAGTEGMKP